MTTTIFLVRHGQTESNVKGFYMGWLNEDINEVGYAQARSLAARLASLPIAAIYTSPLKRTYNTADTLAAPHNLELKVLDDLIEIQQGDWEGLHIDEISQGWPVLWQQSRTDPSEFTMPNGESFSQVTERAVRAFEKIVADNQDKHAVIVAHEVVVKVIIIHAIGASNSIYRRFQVSNASLSTIRVTDGRGHLMALNDTSHLENQGRKPSPQL